jgi:hypothetical protein
MLLFGHRQLEAVGKRFFVLADECGQTLKQMKVSATIGHPARGHFLQCRGRGAILRSSQRCFSKSTIPLVTERPAHTLMNSCPSSVSSLSIVLEGGRSLREVGYVAESASRTFLSTTWSFVPTCLSVGNRDVVQTISRALSILSAYSIGVGLVFGGGESGKGLTIIS